MKVSKQVHPVWTEWNESGGKTKAILKHSIVGKYQYIYSSEKGEISLVELNVLNESYWEIYCLKGELFEDTERFGTKKEAKKRIKELLGD